MNEPIKILVCGTRGKFIEYKETVFKELDNLLQQKNKNIIIIEGCCPDSADQYAEEWTTKNNIQIKHYPSTTGNYLARNIEMTKECDEVLAFYDGWSYGTSHTLANALMQNKNTHIIKIKKIQRGAQK